jgi:capsular polysaccharide biosynthesis protein
MFFEEMTMRHFARNLKRNIRQFLSTLFRKLPISSEYLGPPKKYWKCTKSWHENVDGKHFSTYKEINPAHAIQRFDPNHIDGDVDWRFQIGYLGSSFQTPATFLAEISHGRVYGESGAVITPDDCLLADVSVEFGITPELAQHHPSLRCLKLPRLRYSQGTAVILAAAGGNNYFHWMFDVLPRLHLLKQSDRAFDIDYFLINEIFHPFQKETLLTVDVPAEKIVFTHRDLHFTCDLLIVPSLPGITGSLTAWQCDFLRKLFLAERNNHVPRKRIYISRKDATSRRILNEESLTEILNELDFQIVSMSGLSVHEQANLFYEAEIIVAPHGAAMTNLVFCDIKCKVLEIFAPGYLNPCYRGLSNLIGIDYWYILGTGNSPRVSQNHHLASGIADDITVNIDATRLTLEAMMTTHPLNSCN